MIRSKPYFSKAFVALACLALTAAAFAQTTQKEEHAVSPEIPLKVQPLANFSGANDPRIVYTGRVDMSRPESPSFGFPGVEIAARFEGTAVDIKLGDTGDRDYFNVTIDGGAPMVLHAGARIKVYPIARDLKPGVHEIRLYKRTEGNCGTAIFKGFGLDEGKSLADAPAISARAMEFIGDSITCGYGNMVSTNDPNNAHFNPANENSAAAWGYLTAQAFGARFVSTSYSGRGLFRNNTGSDAGTLPKLYRAIYPDSPEKVAWDPARYKPDVIVINLGTNDYSSLLVKTDLQIDDFDQAYVKTYRAFLADLRSIYGKGAKIICSVGPMMSDGYPQGMNCWSRIQKNVSGLVSELQAAGDKNISYLCLNPQSPPYGEDWHPSAATQANMAQQAIAAVKAATGW
jgi:lysophospholipase L1-like esterase